MVIDSPGAGSQDWTGERDGGAVLLFHFVPRRPEESRGEEGSYDWFVAGSCRLGPPLHLKLKIF